MKKLLIALSLLPLASCAGYENLNTPFEHRGQGVNVAGSNVAQAEANTFEIVVNAPAGTSEASAMDMFAREARKVCGGREYTQQITSTGTAQIREYGVKGVVDSRALQTLAPSVRGYVACK